MQRLIEFHEKEIADANRMRLELEKQLNDQAELQQVQQLECASSNLLWTKGQHYKLFNFT